MAIHLDSYHDHRTSYRFGFNPSGSKRDLILIGTGTGLAGLTGGDVTWNPVWQVETTLTEEGWFAEVRIPFSQLRFSRAEEQTWGVLIERRLRPGEELLSTVFLPRTEPGGVPRFGHLEGIRGIKPGRKLELLPYVGGRVELVSVPRNAAVPFTNPFRGDRELFGYGGVDLKYKITSNVTLDGTINPDFGQVEVDPAVINLTAFETRFQEQRPFFVEGADVFNFGGDVAPQIFYSRRIGRAPHGSAPGEAVYSLSPTGTTILGAAKVSGKTQSGWSMGLLDAVTPRESASWQSPDRLTHETEVEPATNYLAARLRREMRTGETTVGVLATAVNRDLSGSPLEGSVHRAGYSGGVDFGTDFANRAWHFDLLYSPSWVTGTRGALTATQRSSARYFQRPDADYVEVDTLATSLYGYSAQAAIRKQNGNWRIASTVTAVSPGYEVNDLGFQTLADQLTGNVNLSYDQLKPGKHYRTWGTNLVPRLGWNYGGDRVTTEAAFQANIQFHDQTVVNSTFTYSAERLNARLTRGGPLAQDPAGWEWAVNANTTMRRQQHGRLGFQLASDEAGGWSRRVTALGAYKGSARWDVSLAPSFTTNKTTAQYVTAITDATATSTLGRRYVFADLRQTTVALDTRLNVTLSPEVSFEVFAQPFLSNGDYENLKELSAPRTHAWLRYGEAVGTIAPTAGGRFEIDPDGGGPARAFRVDDRDFNFRSLRANAVFRWEWRPGSTLFLVWQQMRSAQVNATDPTLPFDGVGGFDLGRDARDLFDLRADNVLLIKASYWLNP